MISKVEKLYERTWARHVALRVAEVCELREKIDTLVDEVEVKDLKLQSIPGFVKNDTKL